MMTQGKPRSHSIFQIKNEQPWKSLSSRLFFGYTEKLFYNIWTLFVKVQFPFLNLRSLSLPCLASKSWWGQNISYKKVWTLNFFTKTDVLCSWVLCNRILQKKSELVVTNQVQVASNENIKLSHGREWGSNREMQKGKILKSLHS